jgi:hypothetical protein
MSTKGLILLITSQNGLVFGDKHPNAHFDKTEVAEKQTYPEY